ncbi:MAG: o-succinylbenzoate synthase [Bacteroidetes bacterium]|nr:MAG: o-succinylbenzoate synthase [Bacteroidota bacterium]
MLKAFYKKHILNFKFEAGTSRGILNEHIVWYVYVYNETEPTIFGIGEAAPLKGLSIDYLPDFETIIQNIISKFNIDNALDFTQFPSLKFAFETAFLDLKNYGIRKIFDTDFYNQEKKIAINGLVWMNTASHMKAQIIEKINNGFDTIKLKIGAIDFKQELELLKFIRKEFSNNDIKIRLDANGAFNYIEALEKLKQLSQYQIHSIEQPIKQGQEQEMAFLCQHSPIAIALDEELIGISDKNAQKKLLETINPTYIILKPTLLGGFESTKNWIELAKSKSINWWMTSALESNIGLNAICQFCSTFKNDLKQGLGTGSLYKNNVTSPLSVKNGTVYYKQSEKWELLK